MSVRTLSRVVAFFFLVLLCSVAAQAQDAKNVLVLYYAGPHFPINVAVDEALHETLGHEPVQIFEEYLDEDRLLPDRNVNAFREKYADKPIALILAVGQASLEFLLLHGEELWPQIPKVVSLVDFRYLRPKLPPNMTAVVQTLDFAGTLRLALDLQPDIQHVFYVGGIALLEEMRRRLAQEEFQSFSDKLDVTYLNNLPFPALLNRLTQLPAHSVVIYGAIQKDASGQTFVPAAICPLIVDSSTAPVYSPAETFMGHGIVGGSMFSVKDSAQQAARLAVRILNGESVANLPVETGPPNKTIVDRRQLQKWNFAENRLPPGTVVMFREPGAWERYKWYIGPVLAVLLLQFGLIIALIVQRRERERANVAVKQLTGRLISAGEVERQRVARELHDDIGQRLSLARVQLKMFSNQLPANASVDRSSLNGSLKNMDELITDVHDLSHRLHSSQLEHSGLKISLKDLCEQIERQHNLDIQLQLSDNSFQLRNDVALCFYRVAQEALNNVVKHSRSRLARVSLVEDPELVRLQVADSGVGFDLAQHSPGLGLVTMQERLQLVGGRLSTESRPGEGTTVTAEVHHPFDASVEAAQTL
jgi:signal transduction histidine kinase